MITKRKKYTLIECHNHIFGYIHRDVKKEERLALRAVLKEKGVLDITGILYLNVQMLKKAHKYVNFVDDKMEVSITIPFKNFKFSFHDYAEKEKVLCYICGGDELLLHSYIKKDPYLYDFIKKFVNKVNLTNYKMEI